MAEYVYASGADSVPYIPEAVELGQAEGWVVEDQMLRGLGKLCPDAFQTATHLNKLIGKHVQSLLPPTPAV